MTDTRKIDERSPAPNARAPKLLALGGVLGAIGASSCCILPLVLFGFGITGAWIGGMTALTPYQPIFIVITLGFLGTGFYLVYRKPKAVDCEPGSYCASPRSERVVKTALWASTLLVAAAILFPYVAPLLLEA